MDVNNDTIANTTSIRDVSALGTTQFTIMLLGQFIPGGLFAWLFPDNFMYVSVLLGGFMWWCGLFFATLTTNFVQLFGVYAVLSGIGGALVFWSTFSHALGLLDKVEGNSGYVQGHIPIVLAAAGVGQVGFYILGSQFYTLEIIPVIGLSIQKWKLALGVVSFVGFIVIVLFLCVYKKKVPFVLENLASYTGRVVRFPSQINQVLYYRIESAKSHSDYAVMCTPEYTLFVMTTFLFKFSYFVPYLHFVPFMHILGVGSSTFAIMLTLAGSSILGYMSPVILMFISSHFYRPVIILYTYAFIHICLASVLVGWMHVTESVGAFLVSGFYGIFSGASITMLSLVSKNFIDGKYNNGQPMIHPSYLWIPLTIAMACGVIPSAWLSSHIYDVHGGYYWVIGMSAFVQLGAAFVAIILSITVACRVSKQDKDV